VKRKVDWKELGSFLFFMTIVFVPGAIIAAIFIMLTYIAPIAAIVFIVLVVMVAFYFAFSKKAQS
jgi:uncharacterized membrane protein YfcA